VEIYDNGGNCFFAGALADVGRHSARLKSGQWTLSLDNEDDMLLVPVVLG
jgi:hypothetical protein